MTSRRARRGAAISLLCLTLAASPTLAGCASGPVHREAAAAGPERAPAPRAVPPVVAFLGDSYTVGEKGAVPETTYAHATARLLNWQVIVGGRAGTGFSKGRGHREDYLELFETQLGWRPAPDLLIVSGGHNDWRLPAAQVAAAARVVLERARTRWPGTRVVLIGPLWGSDSPPQNALAVRDALRGLAAQLGTPFIDPIGERWITGNRMSGTGNAPQLIRKDGTHPNPAGHRYLATRLADDLRRLGLAHPVRKTG
ncbi:SGNH/GDSL hydrolase family protein [Actinomadura roseirufa]|uniref:SGNH/GDSL hydrolase family protein n=1 Tax=Actinomadura roseirufa TaxID=2094049 RepID=UPI0010410D07|nr:SGNH/GDSL hydrolase family protein [Actinomadura roseirufa]